jgi:hypothetical protein
MGREPSRVGTRKFRGGGQVECGRAIRVGNAEGGERSEEEFCGVEIGGFVGAMGAGDEAGGGDFRDVVLKDFVGVVEVGDDTIGGGEGGGGLGWTEAVWGEEAGEERRIQIERSGKRG